MESRNLRLCLINIIMIHLSAFTMGQPKCDLLETEPYRYIYTDYNPHPNGLRFYPKNHNVTLTFTSMGTMESKTGKIDILSAYDWHVAVFTWNGLNEVKIAIDGSVEGGLILQDQNQNFTNIQITSSHHTYWITCSRTYIMGFCGEVNKIDKSINDPMYRLVTTSATLDNVTNSRSDRRLPALPTDETTNSMELSNKTTQSKGLHTTTKEPSPDAHGIFYPNNTSTEDTTQSKGVPTTTKEPSSDAHGEYDPSIACGRQGSPEATPVLQSTVMVYTLAVVTAVLCFALIVLALYTFKLRRKFQDMDPLKGDMALQALTVAKDRKMSMSTTDRKVSVSDRRMSTTDRKFSLPGQRGYTNDAMN
ncbi:unnamed protein product [Meganyctiphanes norvegica]|uniref:Uncharacterized protein n=1 Tax=Meganyctiphanes norvegica TaxID=48144 RepID=A0AAV2R0X1_MEGNR